MKINVFWRKKVLSLVLCVAVMLSVMVLGAGAAFSDQDQIENTEAVNMCSALNIIGGYEDGSFHPERNIKRSEVTKMICVALNGGKDPNLGTPVNPTFSDVRGTADGWAEKYIESCVAQGIVSGVGGGRFAPTGNVTGSQLAKMLLVSLGYKSENEGFTGNAWETNVNVRASQKGLYTGLENLDVSAAVTRDQAAQMVWNAMNAYEVEYKTTIVTDENGNLITQVTVQDKQNIGSDKVPYRVTLLGDKYEAKTFTGTFTANDKTDTTLKDGQIKLTGVDSDAGNNPSFVYDFDLSYIGEEVSVLYKDNNTSGTKDQPDDKDTIYGVVVTGNTIVYNITSGDLQDGDSANNKIKFGDKEYKAAAQISTTVDYATTSNKAATDFDKSGTYYGNYPTTIKFIVDDGEINAAYVNTYTLARVTAVNSDKVSINNGVGAITFEDNDIYSGIAKDDIVVVQTFYNADATKDDAYSTVTKAKVVSAELTGYKGTENVTFDGTTYKVMGGAFAGTSIDSDFETSVVDQIGETYDFYMIGSYVAAAKLTSDGAKNYAVVTGVTGEENNKANPLKVSILNAAGQEMLVDVDTDGETDVEQNDLISYSVINDSKIKIKQANEMTTKGAGYVKDTKTFDGIVTTADAPLFVIKDGDYYVYNIRDLNDTAAKTYSTKITDDNKVVAALIDRDTTPSGASTDTVYGIVSDNKGSVKIDGTYYTEYSVDTFDKEGTAETKKVLVEGDTDLAKGDLVSFDVAANDVYNDSEITVYTDGTNNATATWVNEYDAKGAILTTWNSVVSNGTSYVGETGKTTVTAFDDDAVIAFVSVADDKGTSDNGVPEFDGVTGYKNVMVVIEDSKIVGMFVDTDNNILGSSVSGIVVEDGKTVIYGGTATVSEGEAVVRAGNVTLSGGSADVYGGTVAMSGGEAKAKGGTFTVTGSSAKIKIGKEIGTPITITIGNKTLNLANYTGDVVKAVENGAFVSDLSSANSGETWIYRDSSGNKWVKEEA